MSTKYKILAMAFVMASMFNTAYATGYNYLPADVLIKQKEEKSALEYRIRSLESQMTGSPSISIGSIESRIRQLEDERDAEKNYVTGTLAKYGAGLSNLQPSLDKIDAKYSNLISDLENQRDYYQEQIDQQKKLDKQIAEIQKQIREIDAYYDQQQIDLKESYSQPEPIEDTGKYTETHTEAEWDAAYAEFLRLDAMTMENSRKGYESLMSSNPTKAKMVKAIFAEIYPDGKEETEDTTYKSDKTHVEAVKPTLAEVKKKVEEKKLATSSEDAVDESTEPAWKPKEIVEPRPEQKLGFFGRIGSFFQRLMFWR